MVEPNSAVQAVKYFRQVLSELSKHTPDAARKKAYKEILEEVLLDTNALVRALPESLYQAAVRALHDLFPEWESDPDHFSPHDVVDALRELFIERARAGTNKKREVLDRAFFSRFRPDIYKAGESRLLWNIVRQLEYPQIWAVRDLIERYQDRQLKNLPTQYLDIVTIPVASPSGSHIRRLEELGLIREFQRKMSGVEVQILPMAFHLREFVWAEEWSALEKVD